MNTIQLIYNIASRPEIETVVINDNDDKTPMQAIEYLAAGASFDGESDWQINTVLEKGTMLVYEKQAVKLFSLNL